MWLSRKCQRNGGEKGGRSVLFRLVLGPPGIIWGCEDFAVQAPWMLLVKELHDDHYKLWQLGMALGLATWSQLESFFPMTRADIAVC